MKSWFLQDLLGTVFPRAIAVMIAVGVAHAQFLAKYGIVVDWHLLQGKLTAGAAVLIGLLVAHHTEKIVKGGTQ